MEKNKCEDCEHFEQCEIKIRLHNPISQKLLAVESKIVLLQHEMSKGNFSEAEITESALGLLKQEGFFKEDMICQIKKGDKIAQITLLEHKSYLFGVESDVERSGGFGSTGA